MRKIVCAILENDGDNNYLSQKGGKSFGVRRCFMTNEDGDGVIPVPLAMTEGETVQAHIINERVCRRLKYEEPTIATLTKAKLTDKMKGFVLANMDGGIMNDELVEYWFTAGDNWVQEQFDDHNRDFG